MLRSVIIHLIQPLHFLYRCWWVLVCQRYASEERTTNMWQSSRELFFLPASLPTCLDLFGEAANEKKKKQWKTPTEYSKVHLLLSANICLSRLGAYGRMPSTCGVKFSPKEEFCLITEDFSRRCYYVCLCVGKTSHFKQTQFGEHEGPVCVFSVDLGFHPLHNITDIYSK